MSLQTMLSGVLRRREARAYCEYWVEGRNRQNASQAYTYPVYLPTGETVTRVLLGSQGFPLAQPFQVEHRKAYELVLDEHHSPVLIRVARTCSPGCRACMVKPSRRR